MLPTDRFMAWAICSVRMVPAAPTRAPAMIMAWLSIAKPAMATARPVRALSSDTMTGASAPPIGSTMSTPKVSAASSTISSSTMLCVCRRVRTPAPRATATTATLAARDPGHRMGLPGTMPCNVPAAISEPENVTDPISTSSTSGTEVVGSRAGPPGCRTDAANATAAAAPPPTALNTLTSCRISVILTRRAWRTP
ncbi:hypothetical protein ADL01_41035 [Streptomyces sp. NRRL WC-3618]|nr:hypothetical protein ADL01_41035 [Streptomyces sp. NRRL WC-3618]